MTDTGESARPVLAFNSAYYPGQYIILIKQSQLALACNSPVGFCSSSSCVARACCFAAVFKSSTEPVQMASADGQPEAHTTQQQPTVHKCQLLCGSCFNSSISRVQHAVAKPTERAVVVHGTRCLVPATVQVVFGTVQVVEFPDVEGPLEFQYDEEWLSVLQATHHLMSLNRRQSPLPGTHSICLPVLHCQCINRADASLQACSATQCCTAAQHVLQDHQYHLVISSVAIA